MVMLNNQEPYSNKYEHGVCPANCWHGRVVKAIFPRLETNKLVSTGVYDCMRHPMHFGLLFFPWSQHQRREVL